MINTVHGKSSAVATKASQLTAFIKENFCDFAFTINHVASYVPTPVTLYSMSAITQNLI